MPLPGLRCTLILVWYICNKFLSTCFLLSLRVFDVQRILEIMVGGGRKGWSGLSDIWCGKGKSRQDEERNISNRCPPLQSRQINETCNVRTESETAKNQRRKKLLDAERRKDIASNSRNSYLNKSGPHQTENTLDCKTKQVLWNQTSGKSTGGRNVVTSQPVTHMVQQHDETPWQPGPSIVRGRGRTIEQTIIEQRETYETYRTFETTERRPAQTPIVAAKDSKSLAKYPPNLISQNKNQSFHGASCSKVNQLVQKYDDPLENLKKAGEQEFESDEIRVLEDRVAKRPHSEIPKTPVKNNNNAYTNRSYQNQVDEPKQHYSTPSNNRNRHQPVEENPSRSAKRSFEPQNYQSETYFQNQTPEQQYPSPNNNHQLLAQNQNQFQQHSNQMAKHIAMYERSKNEMEKSKQRYFSSDQNNHQVVELNPRQQYESYQEVPTVQAIEAQSYSDTDYYTGSDETQVTSLHDTAMSEISQYGFAQEENTNEAEVAGYSVQELQHGSRSGDQKSQGRNTNTARGGSYSEYHFEPPVRPVGFQQPSIEYGSYQSHDNMMSHNLPPHDSAIISYRISKGTNTSPKTYTSRDGPHSYHQHEPEDSYETGKECLEEESFDCEQETQAQKDVRVWGEIAIANNKLRDFEQRIATYDKIDGNSRECYVIEEGLTRLLLKLDKLSVEHNEDLRNKRREVIKAIYASIDKFDQLKERSRRVQREHVPVNQI